MNKAPDENKQTKSGKVRELGFWSICHWPPMCSASSNVLLKGSLASAQDCGGFLFPSMELSLVHLAIILSEPIPQWLLFLISGLFLAVLWFCEIWAFSVANQMHSLVSSFQPLKLGSLVTRPLAAKIRGGLRPWMELLLNIPTLCFPFWEVLWTAGDFMDNLSMTAKQVFKDLEEVSHEVYCSCWRWFLLRISKSQDLWISKYHIYC